MDQDRALEIIRWSASRQEELYQRANGGRAHYSSRYAAMAYSNAAQRAARDTYEVFGVTVAECLEVALAE